MTPRDPRPRGTPPLHNRAEHALNLYDAWIKQNPDGHPTLWARSLDNTELKHLRKWLHDLLGPGNMTATEFRDLNNHETKLTNLYRALDAAKKDRARWKQEASGGLSIPTDLTQDPTLSIHDPQGQLSNAQEPTEIV